MKSTASPSKLESDHPWVVVGDFNDWNKRVSLMIESQLRSKEVFKLMRADYPHTFPSIFPMLSLYRIFVHKLNVTRAEALRDVHWKSLSDHISLYVEVDWPV
jgi:endonuclease/exonuclease/phosphatase family metal-dependent hydrolase